MSVYFFSRSHEHYDVCALCDDAIENGPRLGAVVEKGGAFLEAYKSNGRSCNRDMVPNLLELIRPVEELMGYNEISNKETTVYPLRTLHKRLTTEYRPYELVRLCIRNVHLTEEGELVGRPGHNYIWVPRYEAEAMLGPEPDGPGEEEMDTAPRQKVRLDIEQVSDESAIRGDCSICLCPLPEKGTIKVVGCGHMYCQKCIESMWEKTDASKRINLSCPMCRDPMTLPDLV